MPASSCTALLRTILSASGTSTTDFRCCRVSPGTGIADDETSDITFAKIEDKDCQNREVVNIDGKRYVITDSNKTIAALTDNEELHEAFGLYSSAKVVENVSYLCRQPVPAAGLRPP